MNKYLLTNMYFLCNVKDRFRIPYLEKEAFQPLWGHSAAESDTAAIS